MNVAGILAKVNQITGRAETDIDVNLGVVLTEISRRSMALKTTAEGVTVVGQSYITKPTDIVDNVVDDITIDGEIVYPIVPGQPDGYLIYDDKIYLHPIPSSALSYVVYYARLHPDDLTTILLPDVFFPAVCHYTAAKVYEDYEIQDKIADQLGLYEKQMASLAGYNATPPVCMPYKGV